MPITSWPGGMNQITTETEQVSKAATALDSSGLLMTLIIGLLAPMFLGVSAGNIDLARLAATETIEAYCARNHADLIAVTQIVAFGLAALGSLSLSLADDTPLPMALRLRSNANALNRSAQQNRRALKNTSPRDQMFNRRAMPAEPESPLEPVEPDDWTRGEMFLSPAAEQQLAAEALARLQTPQQAASQQASSQRAVPPAVALGIPAPVLTDVEQRHQQVWAVAMVKEAAKLTASIPHLPPAEREAAALHAAALDSCVSNLMCGQPVQPLKPGALDAMIGLNHSSDQRRR